MLQFGILRFCLGAAECGNYTGGLKLVAQRFPVRERGLAGSDALADAEVYNLIFEPGFSTAEQVTDVSGRGVGLDIVKFNIEKVKGKISVGSRPGAGTIITLSLPLTLINLLVTAAVILWQAQ